MGVCFFSNGETTACLKDEGNMPSERDRLIRCAIGITRASTQDFRSLVGMASREQDKSVEASMRLRISSGEAGSNLESTGGFGKFEGTEVLVLLTLVGIELNNLVILS